MSKIEVCPSCHLVIDESRERAEVLVCNHCGHVKSEKAAEAERTLRVVSFKAVVLLALILVSGFAEVSAWSFYAPELRWLELRARLGSSTAVLDRMAEICMELKKYDCATESYQKMAAIDSFNWSRLARLQYSLGKYEEAVESFTIFSESHSGDAETHYIFAKALAETGRIDQAVDYFELVIKSKPDVLQVTVVQNYVRYLMRSMRYAQAEAVIRRMRRLDWTKAKFMDSEFRFVIQKNRLRG